MEEIRGVFPLVPIPSVPSTPLQLLSLQLLQLRPFNSERRGGPGVSGLETGEKWD
jgi:hypothetical protein